MYLSTPEPPSSSSIFRPGANCLQAARTRRAKLLVDGENYYKTFMRVAERAQRSIIILAWDFDTRTVLDHDEASRRPPAVLGDFLNFLVRRRRSLHVFVLDWDYPMIFGTDREFPPLYGLGWKPRRRVHLRYDNTHPVGGSHHQKIVVIDDAVGFTGGLDLTSRRWDTCEHKADDPRRKSNGASYPPFHDLMTMVDGDAARVLGQVARERWKRATGRHIPEHRSDNDPWPADMQPDMTDVTVGISRTLPTRPDQAEVREVEALYLDLLNTARRYIYIENQYCTANRIGDALAALLDRRDGPEVVIVLRLLSHGWLEEHTMHALRTRLIARLRAADRWNRLGIYYPHIEGLCEGTCVDVHSKLLIVDDEWLRVGSANLCNRSMGMDSECDLTFEARGEARTTGTIRKFRDDLLAEHLDVTPQAVAGAYQRTGTLNDAIKALQHAGRTLKPLERMPEWPEVVIDAATLADPERPVALDELIAEFGPNLTQRKPASRWRSLLIFVVMVAALAAMWRYTPLAEVASAERAIAFAREAGSRWWAPLAVMLAYTPASLLLFPRPLITLFAVIAFGAWMGFAYALSGILLAALATYCAGRLLDRDSVRRVAGDRLNRVSDILRKRGLVAVTALRLVPVAPFAVGSLVAGALRIKLWHYLLGTAIGMLPGTLMTTVFGGQIEAALTDSSRINYWFIAVVLLLIAGGYWAIRRWIFGGSFSQPAPKRE